MSATIDSTVDAESILLFPDPAGRAALGPSHNIFTWHHVTGVRMHDLSGDIVHGRGGMVERHPLDWHRTIANGTQHKTSLDDLQPAGSLRPEPPIGIYDKLIVLDLYGRNPPTRADDLHWGGQKAQA
jgi:hypothetical protein